MKRSSILIGFFALIFNVSFCQDSVMVGRKFVLDKVGDSRVNPFIKKGREHIYISTEADSTLSISFFSISKTEDQIVQMRIKQTETFKLIGGSRDSLIYSYSGDSPLLDPKTSDYFYLYGVDYVIIFKKSGFEVYQNVNFEEELLICSYKED